MIKKYFLLVSFLCLLPAMMHAQKEYPIEQVSAINVGDGRILFRDLKTEKPLNGDHRITSKPSLRTASTMASTKNTCTIS